MKVSLASRGKVTPTQKPQKERDDELHGRESDLLFVESDAAPSANEMAGSGLQKNGHKTLEDAVKPKHRRKKA